MLKHSAAQLWNLIFERKVYKACQVAMCSQADWGVVRRTSGSIKRCFALLLLHCPSLRGKRSGFTLTCIASEQRSRVLKVERLCSMWEKQETNLKMRICSKSACHLQKLAIKGFSETYQSYWLMAVPWNPRIPTIQSLAERLNQWSNCNITIKHGLGAGQLSGRVCRVIRHASWGLFSSAATKMAGGAFPRLPAPNSTQDS